MTALPTQATRAAFRRRVAYPVLMHALMILGVTVVLFPLLFALILSTQSSADWFQVGNLIPGTSAVHNYTTAWERASIGQLMVNTTIVALLVAGGKIFLSISASFALVYFRVRGSVLILGLIMLTHFLPLPVRIVPTYQLLADLGWINTFQGLTVPFFASATGILLFLQFFRTLSPDLADAARVDGAGPLRFLFRILIPISRTNIGALFLIEFIYMWNQYLWPLLVANSVDTRQVQIGIKQLIATDAVIDWGVLMAGTIMVIIPPLVVLLVLQRSLMAGLSAGDEGIR
ncbi:MAG: ABC transporter permease subunit [Anaerolineaceae bacterium]|nr:ABC transporter permease subunit [Anaerolineaceae bacterium]